MTARFGRWVDDQLGLANLAQHQFLRKVFPDHWSFMLGETALYSFLVLLVTGIYLSLFFHAGSETTVYQGSYAPLQGVEMSGAYASVLNISFDVQAGLLIRQIHHWTATVFVAAIAIHMVRVFFTGAFRRPRQLNWMIGLTLLILAVFAGFTGYSIVDDLLSGTGIVIGYSVLLSIPFIGPWLSFITFGGPVPNAALIPRLTSIHVMLLPALISVLLALHLAIIWRQKHTNYPGPGRTARTVVGTRLWPVYATKSVGFFFLVFGVLAALGAFLEINPVWLYGPYDPAAVSSGSQPDWYMGWLEGALRLFPNWEPTLVGVTIPNPFFGGFLLALLILGGLYLYPFIEQRITGDRAVHHVLDRPLLRPGRMAVGAWFITFWVVLTIAGSNDILSVLSGVPVHTLRDVLRIVVILLPLAVAAITYYLCRRLATRASRAAG
jgi:ubiquinol-cytochrome c reductase cytochrome b subunit